MINIKGMSPRSCTERIHPSKNAIGEIDDLRFLNDAIEASNEILVNGIIPDVIVSVGSARKFDHKRMCNTILV